MSTLLTIVFADDHEIFRAGLRQVLATDRNVQVVAEHGDGVAALRSIRELRPGAAVLDLDLPGLSGLEVVRELRRLRDTTPVIILTAHRAESLLDEAIAAGVPGYLLKDNAATDLLQCLRAVAAGETYISPTFTRHLLRRGQKAEELRSAVRGLDTLSAAERRVLRLIALGRSTKEIAGELFLSPATVETHRKNICGKLGLRGANRLLTFAIEHRAELA